MSGIDADELQQVYELILPLVPVGAGAAGADG
jgi:hypothetical protein